MTRGNQRENAREKNLAKLGNTAKKNTQSGAEFARTKDAVAKIMQEKQAKAEAKAAEAAKSGDASKKK